MNAKHSEGLSAEERAAAKQRAAEVRKQSGRKSAAEKREGERRDCEAAIAALGGTDKEIAEMIHRVVTEVAPHLSPKTWYGFPSYARDGKVVLFWQFAEKFGSRYGTLGFNDSAELDEGSMWPAAYAITKANKTNEEQVRRLVRRAAGSPPAE